MIAPSRALALACQFVDIPLLDRRARSLDNSEQLALGLERAGLRDEALARKTAEELTAEGLRLEPLLAELCDRTLFEPRHGLPALRPDLLPRRLIRIVDPDGVMCFCHFLKPATGDAFDWAAVPLGDGGPITGLLRDGSTETHIHLGGSLPPVFFWLCLMSGQLGLEALEGIRADHRGHAEVERWQEAALEAMATRLSLAQTLQGALEGQRGWRPFPHLPPGRAVEWAAFAGRLEDGLEPSRICDAVLALGEVGAERDGEDCGSPQHSDWPFRDPLRLRGLRRGRPHYAAGERRLLCFAAGALRHEALLGSEGERQRLEKRLLRYLRIRNAFHGAMVHGDGAFGLLRFVEAFGRRGFVYAGPGARHRVRSHRHRRLLLALEQSRMAAALDAQLIEPFTVTDPRRAGSGERRIEMRVSLPERFLVPTMRAWLLGIVDHLRASVPRRAKALASVGLLIHLLKHRADDQGTEEARRTIERLWWLLAEHPRLRPLIVGLDAAGSERRAPPRVFASAFRGLQKRVEEHRFAASEPPIRLGYTYHVGEDADDQLTALRHLDEAVCLLLPQGEGGRLGHALALGEAPPSFYARRGGATEPAVGAHLLDLVWAHGRLAACGELHRHAWLAAEILRIASSAGRPGEHEGTEAATVTLDSVERCYRAMGLGLGREHDAVSETTLLRVLGFTGPAAAPVPRAADPAWLALVSAMQELLRAEFARRRLTIEANPTSNLLIGGFASFRDLPYPALTEAGLPLSLNTDDPGLFMTSLPAEYAAMYGALAGTRTHREILVWLAQRRFDADQSSFLGSPVELPIGPDASGELDELLSGP